MARLLVADGGITFDDVLAGDSVSEQVDLENILWDGSPEPTSISPRVRLRMQPRRPGVGTTMSESLCTFLRLEVFEVST